MRKFKILEKGMVHRKTGFEFKKEPSGVLCCLWRGPEEVAQKMPSGISVTMGEDGRQTKTLEGRAQGEFHWLPACLRFCLPF